MKRIILLSGFLLSLIVFTGFTGCEGITTPPDSATRTGSFVSQQSTGIWVSGQGEVIVTPDITILQVGVEAQEETVAEAQSRASEAMDRVLTSLKDNGIEEKDIQTQYFRIDQQTRWDNYNDEEIITGYRVRNTVTAKIRDIENTGYIIDAAVKAGGDLIRIDSLRFTVEDPTIYYDEAREKATADAKAKAEKLAEQTGVNLGEPTFVSESTYTPSVYGGMSYGMSIPPAAPIVIETPTSPGEVEISLTVQIAYSIK